MRLERAYAICGELVHRYVADLGLVSVRKDRPIDLTGLTSREVEKAIEVVCHQNALVAANRSEGAFHPVPPRSFLRKFYNDTAGGDS